MTNKELFKAYSEQDPDLPLFYRYEWLAGSVPEDDWGVVFAGDPKDPKGFFLYFIKRQHGFKKLTHPPLTPYSGPWIRYPEGQKKAQRYGYEKKVLDELIEQLPAYDDLSLMLHPDLRNWLPFYWKGFEEKSCYTYLIEDTSNPDELFGEMRGNIRREIRKAEKSLSVRASDSLKELHELKLKDYDRKGMSVPYSLKYFEQLDKLLAPHGRRELLYAMDEAGNTLGGIYLVMDSRTCYYLVGAADPDAKNKGVMSLLMWKGIEKAAERSLAFDFEGSMIEPIERFFRSFGAQQVPYHLITKTPSPLLRIRKAIAAVRRGA